MRASASNERRFTTDDDVDDDVDDNVDVDVDIDVDIDVDVDDVNVDVDVDYIIVDMVAAHSFVVYDFCKQGNIVAKFCKHDGRRSNATAIETCGIV